MYILLSPSKTFDLKGLASAPAPLSQPQEQEYIYPIAQQALRLNDDELAQALHLNSKQLAQARIHWQRLVSGESKEHRAALLYSGMVFKRLEASSFSAEDWLYAQEHLGICSFAYGLLRPADGIRPYRMEGDMPMQEGRVFEYHRDRLTPRLIQAVQATGGTLIFLASQEMKQLFHWAEIENAVRVITPTFLCRKPSGKLGQITIYTKMARGAMTRQILQARSTQTEELKQFSPEGFAYAPELSCPEEFIYLLNG